MISLRSEIGDANRRIFYPGVTDRAKARIITIKGGEIGPSYDFDARVLPVVPIPVVLDPVSGSPRLNSLLKNSIWSAQPLKVLLIVR